MSQPTDNSNEFVSWRENEKVSHLRHLNCKDLLYLNVLCHTYHAGFGYNTDETFIDDDDSPLIIAKDHLSAIKECVFSDDGYRIAFDVDEARKLACC